MKSEEKLKNKKTGAWIKAMRLRTLPLSFSVIITGNANVYFIAAEEGSWINERGFSWPVFVLSLSTTLLLQILSNFANDYGDGLKGADNNERIGPKRALQSGIISPEEMKKGIIISSLLALISGVYLLLVSFEFSFDWTLVVFFILGLLSIAAAIQYTIGKGAYGYKALGDFFVFIFFGIIGVCGSYYLQHHTLGWKVVIAGSTMGAFSVAVLNLNNMRDRKNDAIVGKKTLAILLGFKGSKTYHFILFVLAWWPIIYLFFLDFPLNWEVILYFSPVLIIHTIHLIKVFKVEQEIDYDPELKKIALSTFLFSLILFGLTLINVS